MYATTLGYKNLYLVKETSTSKAEDDQNLEQATLAAVVGEWCHKKNNNGGQKPINKSEDKFEDFAKEGTVQDIVSLIKKLHDQIDQ